MLSAKDKIKLIRNPNGFTLIELIAVMIIIGILAALAVPRYIDLETNAKSRAIDAGVSELNGRESLTWANVKISSTSGTDTEIDTFTWNRMNTDNNFFLGDAYSWTTGPLKTGNSELRFKNGSPITISRSSASNRHPAVWKR